MQFTILCVLRIFLFVVGELDMNNRADANQGARNQRVSLWFLIWQRSQNTIRCIVPLGKTRLSFYRQEIILSHLPTSLRLLSFQGKASL